MNEKPLRVLLVDDEASFRNPLKKFLESQHHFIVVDFAAAAGAQANLKECRGAYDVALVDEIMEGEISGTELLQWIKAHYPHLEVIVYTAWGMENALNALRYGAFRYLTKPFNPEELALLVQHAAEVAQLRTAAREKDVLSNLMVVSTALLNGRDEEEILQMALQAIHAIGFDRVRLYELQENGAILKARAHVGMEASFLQARWETHADELMQQVLRDPKVHLFRRQPGEKLPYEDFLDKSDVDEWICAPLVVDGQVIGKLSADKKYSKAPVTDAEKGPIELFTSMAAMALENNRLLVTTRQRAEELEKLRKNTLAITANLDRETLLKTIIQGAVELLGARRGGIYEYHPQRQALTVIADYGHGKSTRGHTLKAGEGLAGRLVISEEEYLITEDYSCWPERSDHYEHDEFRAVVEVPLVWEEQRTGVLYVEDGEGRRFTPGDAHLLSRFADYAAIALEQAWRMSELTSTRDGFARVIESSFDGIIAIDLEGKIREYNSRAEQILEYQREEVIGQPIWIFYDDQTEARRMARLLTSSPGGRVVDHPTRLKNKKGQEVPVRLSATWLYDAQGQRAGSVGYFQDIRYIREIERHRQLLLEANEAVARAETLEQGLCTLAESMTMGCLSTFGAIYLYHTPGERLQIKAAHPIHRQQQFKWDPYGEGQGFSDQHPLFRLVASQGETFVLKAQDPGCEGMLEAIAANVRLEGKLSSALVVPLALGGVVRGMCILGEMRSWPRQPFQDSEIRLVESLTQDAAALLEKMELQELTNQQLAESERQKRLWETLAQSLRYIHPARERDQLQQEIANQVADLMEYPYACLLIHHPLYQQLETVRVLGLAEDLKGVRVPVTSEPFYASLNSGEILGLEDIDEQPWRAALFGAAPVRSVLVIPFQSAGELVAVLVLGDERLHRARPGDIEVLKRFSTQAVAALQTSELIGSEKRKVAQLLLLRKISEYIQQPIEDLPKIFDAALTGVTAVYGLGFNRAAILLTTQNGDKLVGRKGIGHLDKKSAEQDWANYLQQGMDDINRYLVKLERSELASTPMDAQIQGLEIPLHALGDDPFSLVIAQGSPLLLASEQVARLPANFIEAFQPGASFTVAPLVARKQVIGLLVADNKFTRMPVTEDLLEALKTFANAIAMAVDNAQLIQELKRGQSFQRALFEASGELISAHDQGELLNRFVEQVGEAAQAFWVSLLMVGKDNQVQVLATYGLDVPIEPENIIRRSGLTMKIIHSREAEVIPTVLDRQGDVHPRMLKHGVKAAVGLPVILDGAAIGVLWVHYHEPHYFSPRELEALQLYANQAALALDKVSLMNQLQRTKSAVEKVAQVMALGDFEVTKRLLVESTSQVASCDAVVLYTLDEESNILDYPPTMTGVRYPERAKRFTRVTPESIVYKMLNENEPYVVETLEENVFFRGSRFTLDEEVRAVVAVPLVAYGNKKGIMFVNYRNPQKISDSTLNSIKLFAHQAAIAVHNAKLYEQEKQSYKKLGETYAELEKTKGLVGSRQALAWMGMVSNTFRHSLESNMQIILDNMRMVERNAAKHELGSEFAQEIKRVRQVAKKVRQMPITAPLSEEEGVYPFSIGELLRERLTQKRDTFAGVTLELQLGTDESTTVKADPQWIRRALDILLENAVEAMEKSTSKVLTVSAVCQDGRVEVRVRDTGYGIPPEIQPMLFKDIIRKKKREKGLGVGLLMASTIFQTYQGDVGLEDTSPAGTTMLCWLPAVHPADLA